MRTSFAILLRELKSASRSLTQDATRYLVQSLTFRLPREVVGTTPSYGFFDITLFHMEKNFDVLGSCWGFICAHIRGINCYDSPCHSKVIPQIQRVPRGWVPPP